jgi:hypothetical protein
MYAFLKVLRERWKAGLAMLRYLAEEGKFIYLYTIMNLNYHGTDNVMEGECYDFF